VETGLEAASAAAASGDTAVQSEVVSGLRGVSTTASRLLVATKTLLVDPNAHDARNQLTAAARLTHPCSYNNSINQSFSREFLQWPNYLKTLLGPL